MVLKKNKMKKKSLLILALFLVTSLSLKAQDCSAIKNNNFTYKNGGKEILVVIGENDYIEYHNKKKHYIKSDIEWVSDCEYNLIIRESTLPNFPFKMGTVMTVKIDKVRGKKIYYTATLGGRSWEWKMTRV